MAGAWVHVPITVGAGGSVLITVDRTASGTTNAVLSGLFLGGGSTPPPPPTAPGAPTGLTATAGNAQVSLAWSAPASDGGSQVTGYTATASPGGATCSTTGALGCTIGGLTNGTGYSFTVKATNAVGTGPASASASATPVAPVTAPGAPQNLVATAGNGQVSLSWSAPSSDGGSQVTGYTATASPGGATCSTTGTLTCTVTGLTNGTAYTFTVRATNAVGTGPASASAGATPVAPATVPGAPTGLTATPGNGQVSLSWSAPSSDGGSQITGYAATASPGGATCTTTGTLGCTVTGLTNGTLYTFTVKATNGVGTGPASASASATPVAPASPPGAPQSLTATPGNARVDLAWAAPSSNGGSPITGYRVYRATTSGAEALVATLGVVTTYADTARTNGTTYFYQVAAVNAAGIGPRSAEVSAKPATVPTAPRSPSAARNPTKGVTLAWTAPSSNGGSAVTGYRVYRGTISGSETFLVAIGNVTTYVDAATTAGVRYYYRLSAVNAVGEGPLSSRVNAIAR